MGAHGSSRELMGAHGRSWEIVGAHGSSWEIMGARVHAALDRGEAEVLRVEEGLRALEVEVRWHGIVRGVVARLRPRHGREPLQVVEQHLGS